MDTWRLEKIFYIYLQDGDVTCVPRRMSGDQRTTFEESGLFFHHLCPRDSIQVIRLGNRQLYPLSHLAHPLNSFFQCVHSCARVHMEVKRQPVGACSLLPPCGSQVQNSDHQTWRQVPLIAEPSHQPTKILVGITWVVKTIFLGLIQTS